jgi:hypothetical protein
MRGLTATEVMVLEDANNGGVRPYLAVGDVKAAVHQLCADQRAMLVAVEGSPFGPTAKKVVVTAAGRTALMIHRFLRVAV